MNDFRNRLYTFMAGRYGLRGARDFLQILLYGVYLLLAVVHIFVRSPVLSVLQWSIIGYALFRILSKNIPARENESRIAGIWIFKFRDALRFRQADAKERKRKRELQRERRQDKTHIYRTCPACGATLRLPRRKGKHEARCPRCAHTFHIWSF